MESLSQKYKKAIIEHRREQNPDHFSSTPNAILEQLAAVGIEDWLRPTLRFLGNLEQAEQRKKAIEIIAVIKSSIRETTGLPTELRIAQIFNKVCGLFPIKEPWLENNLTKHEVHSIDLELLEQYDGLKIDRNRNLIVVETANGEKQEITIPPAGVGIKGGNARILLHKIFGKDTKFLLAETPPNDIDYVILNPSVLCEESVRAYLSDATLLDIKNISLVERIKPEQIIVDQDITHNSCLITQNSLWFTNNAKIAFETATVMPNTRLRTGFYGKYYTIENGVIQPTEKQLFRTMKLVAEGRAETLLISETLNHGLGKYWLTATNRYLNKPNFFTKMNNLFLLEREMGLADGDDFVDSIIYQSELRPHTIIGELPNEIEFYLLSKLTQHITEYFMRENDNAESAEAPKLKKVSISHKTTADELLKMKKKFEEFMKR